MNEITNKNTIRTASIVGLTVGIVGAAIFVALSNKKIRKKIFDTVLDAKDKVVDLFEKVKDTSEKVNEDVKDTLEETGKLLAENNTAYGHN